MNYYIGLDAHAATSTAVVVNECPKGKGAELFAAFWIRPCQSWQVKYRPHRLLSPQRQNTL